ncbi:MULTISPECIES: helix-turn-helix transcriptional regulator [unclassified Saccharothrix]|uniref:helix-turn-helix transcriptional regulator n=1 Tax=unclassified Saccharothrix TaxID=2593673 RepID=UPI00307EF24D
MSREVVSPYLRNLCTRPAHGTAVRALGDHVEIRSFERELVRGARVEVRRLSVDGRPGEHQERETFIGVRRRVIHVVDEHSITAVAQAVAGDDEVRVLHREQPVGLLVVDDVAVVSDSSTTLVVRVPAVVALVAAHFDALWTAAVPLTEGDPRTPSGLSAVQLRILRLAAGGFKDDTIARMLGLSARSVRRHMEKLAALAGTTNRLSLGVAATRLGWV